MVKYQREKTLGYFNLMNVLDATDGAIYTFHDIDLLLIAPPDWSDEFGKKAVEELEKMSKIADPPGFNTVEGDPKSYTKCCINNKKDPSKSIDQYLNGYARVITYKWDTSSLRER